MSSTRGNAERTAAGGNVTTAVQWRRRVGPETISLVGSRSLTGMSSIVTPECLFALDFRRSIVSGSGDCQRVPESPSQASHVGAALSNSPLAELGSVSVASSLGLSVAPPFSATMVEGPAPFSIGGARASINPESTTLSMC